MEQRAANENVRGRTALVGGGTRSGKSAFAVALGRRLGARRAFVATARAFDAEMARRIERHRAERDGAFVTVEEPMDLRRALNELGGYDVVVVDCVTHWLSNLLLADRAVPEILEEVDRVVATLAERRFHAVLVTNEVGMSVHPETALGRAFVEVSGWANQRLARAADEAYVALMGTVLQIRPVVGPAFT